MPGCVSWTGSGVHACYLRTVVFPFPAVVTLSLLFPFAVPVFFSFSHTALPCPALSLSLGSEFRASRAASAYKCTSITLCTKGEDDVIRLTWRGDVGGEKEGMFLLEEDGVLRYGTEVLLLYSYLRLFTPTYMQPRHENSSK